MAFIKLQFKPGMDRDQTNYSNEGCWWDGDKIRFRSGYPQKLGGWNKIVPTGFYGVCRQMWDWITTFSDNFVAVGTNNKVYIVAGGLFNDITPLRTITPTLSTPNTDNCVQTFNGTTTIQINLGTVHNIDTGYFVTISGVASAIGGVPASEINGNHIVTYVSSTAFSFQSTTAATSNVAAGGGTTVVVSFEIAPGNASATLGYGWGTGTWSRGTWGSGSTSPIVLPQQDWFFDNFNNDLAMNIRNGAPYWWVRGATADPTTALATRAITLQAYAVTQGFLAADVPSVVGQLLVAQQNQHLIAFGAVPYGSTATSAFDPLLIRWANQSFPGEWVPTALNSAGYLRVSRGSRIVRALPTRQEILVFTDTHLYTMQYLGTTDVFGLQEYADNISIISPRAVISAANITYWMGQDKFYAYTGRVETLPCTIRDYVFNDINLDQADQVICGTNEQWSEIWWFYPSASSSWNNKYVIYNHLENLWYYGYMERTAWLDTPLQHYPMAADTGMNNAQGYLYFHENGVDDDGSAMSSFIQSNDFDLGDGDSYMLCRRMIPDVDFSGSTAGMTPSAALSIRPRNFPGDAVDSAMTQSQNVTQVVVNQYTNQVFMRARARQMAFQLQSTGLGVQWQMGAPRLDVRQDGRR